MMAGRQSFVSAPGLCTASPPLFSLVTRYCGSSFDARTVRPAASVSSVIFFSTVPSAVPPWLFHVTWSPLLNVSSAMPGDYPPPPRSHRLPPGGLVTRLRKARKTDGDEGVPMAGKLDGK